MVIIDGLFETIAALFNIIWAILDVLVFELIKIAFNLFIRISELDILSNTDLSGIYQRITMILTIVMVFYVTFEFVKYTVSPEVMTEKEKGVGGVVKRIIISILLIAFIPTIFSFGYKLQNRIIKTQIFSRVILGQEEINYDNIGGSFAADVFSAFLYVDYDKCEPNCTKQEEYVETVIEGFKQSGSSIWPVVQATFKDIFNLTGIEFQGLLAFIFGCFIVYILFLYCMDLGVRYAQLLFLQILSPIAIISYIAPKKDSMLQKWGKQCITTYLDLFIRIALMYFMILIISILRDSLSISEMTRNGDRVGIFVYLFMVLGLLIFAQRAPKLIKDLFPSSNAASIGFGFSSKERTEPLGKSLNTIKKPIAATTGAITGTARAIASLKSGDLTKGLKGFKRKNGTYVGTGLQKGLTGAYAITKAAAKGASAGAKDGKFKDAMAAGRQSVQKDESVVNKGGTLLGHDFRGGHYQDQKVKLQVKIEDLEAIAKAKENVASAVKEMKVMKTTTSYKEEWDQRGIGDASARSAAVKAVEKATRIYAVSKKDQTAQDQFKASIATALEAVYIPNFGEGEISEEQQKILDESKKALNTALSGIYSNLEIGSTNWNIVETEIKEAERISTGQKYVGKDEDGDPVDKTVGQISISQFAEEIGDVADAARKAAADEKYKDETRRANANASENNK